MKAKRMSIALCACLAALTFVSGCAPPGAQPTQSGGGTDQTPPMITAPTSDEIISDMPAVAVTPIPGTKFTDEYLELDRNDTLDSLDVLSNYKNLEKLSLAGATVPVGSRLPVQPNLDGLRSLSCSGLYTPSGERIDVFDFLADVLPMSKLEALSVFSPTPGDVLPKIETLKVIDINAPNAPEIVSANAQVSKLYLSGQDIVDDLDALSAFTELEHLAFPVNVKSIEGLKSCAKLKYLALDTPLRPSEIEAYLTPLYELQNLEHVTLGFLMRDDGLLMVGLDFSEYIEIITNLPSSVLEHFRVDPNDNRELPLLVISWD